MKKIILIIVLLIVGSVGVLADPFDGILSYWKLDVDSSTQDDSVGTHDGTVTSATYTASGKISGAYDFDATNDKIDIPNHADFNFDTGDFSISVWFKTEVVNINQAIISKGNGQAGIAYPGWRLQLSSTTLYFYASNGHADNNNYCLKTAMVADTWYHVVATRNSTGVYMKVNGVSQNYANEGGASDVDNTHPLGIGYKRTWEETAWFNGIIDEVGIWNRSLTDAEIIELYNSGDGLQYPFTTTFSNWNMTSDGGCTNWDDDINNSCNTTDSTPTITVDTSGDVDCRIGKTDVNWLMMGDTRNCSTTGGTSHICTLNETDSLSSGNQFIYINCNKDQGTEVNSGGLNITYLADTCSCPGLTTNWEIDMTDMCQITTDCNISTGILNFTGASGWANLSARIDCNRNMGVPSLGTTLWMYGVNAFLYLTG